MTAKVESWSGSVLAQMRLAVFSYKCCWPSAQRPGRFATDGGFAFQMDALSELFASTTLVVPVAKQPGCRGEVLLDGRNLTIQAVTLPFRSGLVRKLHFPIWLLRNCATIYGAVRRADALHAVIPGDIGTVGMIIALCTGKPLFVRHCGNWLAPVTRAEFIWKWMMEKYAGGRNVMAATGGTREAPSQRNPSIRWIFSTSLRKSELDECAKFRHAPDKASPRLIIVARQERAKGTAAIIQSLPLIAMRFPGVRLDVVGDGGALPEFRRLAAELEVLERVAFHGNVHRAAVLELLRQADLFCFPTRSSDGFPKAVHEALACGLPVVATPVSVLPLLIARGCGVLLKDAVPEELAPAIAHCLADDSNYAAMSSRAIQVAQEYSLERWRDQIGSWLADAWRERAPS